MNSTTSTNPLQEFNDRQQKVKDLRNTGIQPYQQRFIRSHTLAEARRFGDTNPPRPLDGILQNPLSQDSKEINGQRLASTLLSLAGRLMLLRPHGKLTFAQLKDHTGTMQICFMQDFLGQEQYKQLKKIDMADFIGVEGELFFTKHGELTLLVKEYELLSKTLRPLPEKFHGLKDQEAKYRYRYLELLTAPQAYQRFMFRTQLISATRRYLDSHEFIEVETPILTTIASGAAAKPFVTHHEALDMPMFLRIAPETYLKRCVVGGFDRVYEFAKCFRNEGIDPSHLQEFTMLEYYAAYWNYEDNMDFTEQLITSVIKEVTGSLQIECLDREGKVQTIDITPPWPRISFCDLIKKDSGIDILEHYGNADSLREVIKKQGIQIEKMQTMGYGNLCDALYKKVSRPHLIQPAFVIKHPVDTKPLARRNDQDPRLADTFQLLLNTWEIVNAYSELVDPADQRERLVRQAEARAHGDEEAMPMDEDYLLAMEHGMPPMSGFGMGIDRLVALLTTQDNLKDTVLFPIMKPESQ